MTANMNRTARRLVATMTPEGQRKALDQQLLGGLGVHRHVTAVAPLAPYVGDSCQTRRSDLDVLITPASRFQPSRPEGQVQRSVRGTIEFISHPTGTSVKPKFRNGVLISVQFEDGSRLIRLEEDIPWVALDAECRIFEDLQIAAVSMNQAGVLTFITMSGVMTVIGVDGEILQIAA